MTLPQPPHRGHILVVDDEPAICQSLAEALRAAGLEADAATTCDEALAVARSRRPDLVIADLRLAGQSGLEVVDRLRQDIGEVPAIFMTGYRDPDALFEASRRRPVELIHKPVNLDRLHRTVTEELARRAPDPAADPGPPGRAYSILCHTCADLTAACRDLRGRLDRQEIVNRYQTDLIACQSPDDVFRRLFCLFLERSGAVFGAAMLCDDQAELQLIGRFGVPMPDGAGFAESLAKAALAPMLEKPQVTILDAMDNLELFPAGLHTHLVGVTVLAMPLMVRDAELIGLVALYRKGEQPFTDDDLELARAVALPTATAVQKPWPRPQEFEV